MPAIVTGSFAATYLMALSSANMLGRLGWATISDYTGWLYLFIYVYGYIYLFMFMGYIYLWLYSFMGEEFFFNQNICFVWGFILLIYLFIFLFICLFLGRKNAYYLFGSSIPIVAGIPMLTAMVSR